MEILGGYRNFINLDAEQVEKPIYRIIPFQRLYEIIERRRLTLVKPKLWDDPFENALLAATFTAQDGEKFTFSAKDSVYGQCWTLHRETDAMWRIYSPKKDGVRLTSTPRKMLEALASSDPTYCRVRAFIGKVLYKKRTDLVKALKAIDLFDTNGSGIAESLLLKRNEFRHEAEVRLIYSGEDGACPENAYSFAIDPSALFDKLMFDPRLDIQTFRSYSSAIRELKFGGPIQRSSLYEAPRELVFPLRPTT